MADSSQTCWEEAEFRCSSGGNWPTRAVLYQRTHTHSVESLKHAAVEVALVSIPSIRSYCFFFWRSTVAAAILESRGNSSWHMKMTHYFEDRGSHCVLGHLPSPPGWMSHQHKAAAAHHEMSHFTLISFSPSSSCFVWSVVVWEMVSAMVSRLGPGKQTQWWARFILYILGKVLEGGRC